MDFNIIDWDYHYNGVILLNFTIIILMFVILRKVSGLVAHVNSSDELSKKSNGAFGISLAGLTLAVAIILKGAIYGELANNMFDSIVAVGLYSIVAIGLMYLTRVIFDNIALPNIRIQDEISKGNHAAAIIDAGNVIATAIILSTVISWITVNNVEKITVLLIGFALSQVILTATTYIYIKIFGKLHNNLSIESIFKSGNVALALRFAGRKIGTAFAIMAASHIIPYELDSINILLLSWFVISIITIFILWILCRVTDFFVLYKINVNKAILDEGNIAIGALQGSIYISLGLLLSELVL